MDELDFDEDPEYDTILCYHGEVPYDCVANCMNCGHFCVDHDPDLWSEGIGGSCYVDDCPCEEFVDTNIDY